LRASGHAPLSETMIINPMPSPQPEPAALAERTPGYDDSLDSASMRFQQIIDLPSSPNTGDVTIPKAPRALHLPSFESLGIARGSPQLFAATSGSRGLESSHAQLGLLTPSTRRLASSKIDESLFQDSCPSLQGLKAVKSFVLTHTPPDDVGSLDWGMPDVKGAADASSTPVLDSRTSSIRPSRPEQDRPKDFKSSTSDLPSCESSSGRAPWLSEALSSICMYEALA
jgi:hypothetical protein